MLSRHSNRNIDANKEFDGLLRRSAPSRIMSSYINNHKSYDIGPPNEAEQTMLNDLRQKLTPALFAQIMPMSCVAQYELVTQAMKDNDVEYIASYDLNGQKHLRIKRLSKDVYTESTLTSAESLSLSDEQWQFFLTFTPTHM